MKFLKLDELESMFPEAYKELLGYGGIGYKPEECKFFIKSGKLTASCPPFNTGYYWFWDRSRWVT